MSNFKRGLDLGAALSMDKINAYGDYTLACNGRIVRPTWDNGYTVVRFLPGLDPDDETKFDVFRRDNSPTSFGEWIISLKSVRRIGIGDDTRTFNLNTNDEDQNPDNSPYGILYNTLARMEKYGKCPAEWAKLLKGGRGKSAPIPAPKLTFYAACLVYFNGDKVLNPLDSLKRLTIMAIPTSAGRAMSGLFMDDWNKAMEQSTEPINIVDFDKGAFVTFWNNERTDPHSTDVYTRQDNLQFRAYMASFDTRYPYQHAKYYGLTPDLPEVVIDAYKQVAVPLRKALKFMSHEEQAELIGQVLPPEVLTYAWDGYEEWLAKGVKRRAAIASTSAPVQYMPTAVSPQAREAQEPIYAPSPVSQPVVSNNQPEPQSNANLYTQFAAEIAEEVSMDTDEDGGANWGTPVSKKNGKMPY